MLDGLENRIRRDLLPGPMDECWEWMGHQQTNGYGQFSWAGRNILAHRAAWMVWVGEIPAGAMLCHTCDNKVCCNPDHLYVGTAKTNGADAKRRGRSTAGDRHPRRKLSSEDVGEIRARYAAGGVLQRELGAEYGVTENQVWRIVNRYQWSQD